jgi:hypothetical protein
MSNAKLTIAGAAAVVLTAVLVLAPPLPAGHARAIRASLDTFCIDCHNSIDLAGDIDFSALDTGRVHSDLAIWETAVRKLRSGEMPPPDSRRAPGQERAAADAALAELATQIDTGVDAAFDRLPFNPGRVTARRLNRIEYQNTIRDLLGVDFVAGDEFPADDTVLGFDNNAEVLTVSPTLTQQYLTAAEKIAARAVGGNALPEQAGFFSREDRVRRIDGNSIALTDVLDYDAEYLIQIELEGNRGENDPPVDLVVSVDGVPVFETSVAVQKGRTYAIGGNTQRLLFDTRVFLSAARHTIRADFVNDPFIETLAPADYRNNNRNIYPNSIRIAGPYPAEHPPQVAKAVLSCDPDAGRGCVETILERLVYRAFRRPVGADEIGPFLEIYDAAAALGYSPREGLQYAIAAVLVSPHFLFRREP